MFRTLLLASAAAVAFTAAASAADLPVRGPAPAPYAPVFSWAGFYVGGQVGYSWNENAVEGRFPALFIQSQPKAVGAFGGLHTGYNFQSGAFVYGLEADVNYANLKGNAIGRLGNVLNAPNNHSATLGVNGSVRARLGVAFGNLLPYITGGVALADNKYTINHVGGQGSFSKTMIGWTAGAGAEYALSNNWTARIEYRYTDYGSAKGHPLAGFPNEEYTGKTKTQDIRLGLSYKFGGPSAVVAKY